MEKENIIKVTLTLILAGAAAYFRQLLGPLIVLAIVMVIDYVTGMTQAWVSATLSSRVGLLGIVKKIGYIFAVAVAVVVDYVIASAAIGAGVNLERFNIFGLLVTIWLILNECISILENLSEIGVPLPGFLVSIVKKLKKSTEKAGDEQAKETVPDADEELDAETLADLADLAADHAEDHPPDA